VDAGQGAHLPYGRTRKVKKAGREREGGRVMKCKNCGSESLYPLDTDDHECDCGAMYCGECNAEMSREGQLLATYGTEREGK